VNDEEHGKTPGAEILEGYANLPAPLSPLQIESLAMSDTLPDRLCNDPDSPYYNEEVLKRDVGIRFAGKEKTNVEEYCVSEGWIRVAAGTAKDRFGKPLTIKLKGPVEPYFREKKEEG
jgi:hypothetical protein